MAGGVADVPASFCGNKDNAQILILTHSNTCVYIYTHKNQWTVRGIQVGIATPRHKQATRQGVAV